MLRLDEVALTSTNNGTCHFQFFFPRKLIFAHGINVHRFELHFISMWNRLQNGFISKYNFCNPWNQIKYIGLYVLGISILNFMYCQLGNGFVHVTSRDPRKLSHNAAAPVFPVTIYSPFIRTGHMFKSITHKKEKETTQCDLWYLLFSIFVAA